MSSRPENMPHHAAFFSSKLELSDCLTNTITDEKQLQETKDLMKSKMEAFITNLQGKLVKSLQELESEKSDKKFLVDRWTREEVNHEFKRNFKVKIFVLNQ
jgi:peptidoglycan hydrolase CwlO-like protein